MKNDFIPQNIGIVLEQKIVAPSLLVQQRETKKFATTQELYYYLSHELNNNRQIDGRINFGLSEDGQILANSVSPYSKTFEDNVEEDIRELVNALRKKRYLTYSSCQGHCIYSRRFVGLAFPNMESRKDFIDSIRKDKLLKKLITFNELDSVANMKLAFDESNRPKPGGKIKEDVIRDEEFVSNEAEFFNVSFHRSYERYYFVEMIILNRIPLENDPTPIKSLGVMFLKRFFWNRITNRLVRQINSDEVKKFKF